MYSGADIIIRKRMQLTNTLCPIHATVQLALVVIRMVHPRVLILKIRPKGPVRSPNPRNAVNRYTIAQPYPTVDPA